MTYKTYCLLCGEVIEDEVERWVCDLCEDTFGEQVQVKQQMGMSGRGLMTVTLPTIAKKGK